MAKLTVYGRDLQYHNDKNIGRICFSRFEDNILFFIHKQIIYPDSEFSSDLSRFFCFRAKGSYLESIVSVSTIKQYLANKVDAIYDFIDDDEMGVPYRLMDYFPNQRLRPFIQFIEKEQQNLANGGILDLSPFFYCCRSEYYVNNIAQSIMQQIFVSQLDTNYFDGKSNPFWEIWDESPDFKKSTQRSIKKDIRIAQMACFAFMWYRLKDKFPRDNHFQQIDHLSNMIVRLLIDNQLPDGSWPDNSDELSGSIDCTCKVVHALSLCSDIDAKEAIQAAGRWLQKQWKSSELVGQDPGFDCLWIDSISMCQGKYEIISFTVNKDEVNKQENESATSNSSKTVMPIQNKHRDYIYSIKDRLAYLALQVKSGNRANLTDDAVLAESFIVAFLNTMNNWHLKNANEDKFNYVGIDLISKEEKIIVQVTSNNSREKIISTINHVDIEQYYGYRLIHMILGDKKNYRPISSPKYIKFNVEEDVWDNSFLVSYASHLDINTLEELEKRTRQYYGEYVEKPVRDDQVPVIPAIEKENTPYAITPTPTLFISYCGKDEPVATEIRNQIRDLLGDNLKISVYTDLNYRESFREFMNKIQDHDYVLCIVSDHYLKSKPCMYEVGEVIKDHHYQQKLLFVIIGKDDECYYSGNKQNFAPPDIYSSEEKRLDYVLYWQTQCEILDEKIKRVKKQTAAIKSLKELAEIEKIYNNDIGEFLTYLAEYKGMSLREHFSENLYTMIKQIFPKYNRRIFDNENSLEDLLSSAILRISKITGTDYNQIALNARNTSYENSLIVFADKITTPGKQVYRKVHMKGLMGKAYSDGTTINIPLTMNCPDYFRGVRETQSELVIPIKIRGDVVGVINSESEEANYYSSSMINALEELASEFGMALRRLGYSKRMDMSAIPYIHDNLA